MNRWEFTNQNWSFYSSSTSTAAVGVGGWGRPDPNSIASVLGASGQFDVWRRGADGSLSLSASAQRNLDGATSSNFDSGACKDQGWALTLSYGMWGNRNNGNPLYLYNGLILTGFNSFSPAHASAPYE